MKYTSILATTYLTFTNELCQLYKVIGPNFTKCLHDTHASYVLILCTIRPYCNSFSSTSAPNASGISRQRPLTNCENMSSISRDIRPNKPIFWPCHTRRSQMSPVNAGVTRPNFTKFSHDIQASLALLTRPLR